jgi:hypothetical protein
MRDGIDKEELRRLVRDVLRSTLSGNASDSPAQQNLLDRIRQAILPGGSGVVVVSEDLNRFAQTLVDAAAQEDVKAAIMSSRLTFKANEGQGPPRQRQSETPVARGGDFRLDNGMLNETRLAEIGKSHTRIILGAEVVVTPLARDRARELKLELVRAKP